MAFLTEAKVRAAYHQGRATKTMIDSELRKSAASLLSKRYDVFLCHSFLDASLIVGVKETLKSYGLEVYVDWQDDPQADRSSVTAETADRLRTRMRNCKSLIFTTSATSARSVWMPWELGYFDGYRPGHVAILPIVKVDGQGFPGQEYLALYPYIEEINFKQGGFELGIWEGKKTASRLKMFATDTWP